MKVLVVADAYPYPIENGQALRIYHYVRLLSERHTFDLACFAETSPPKELLSVFRRIDSYPRPGSQPAATRWGRIREAFSVSGMMGYSADMHGHLDRVLEECAYDLIWISGDAVMACMPSEHKAPLLGDLVDDGVLAGLRDLSRIKKLRPALRQLKWIALTIAFERRYFGAADLCLLVSETDARWFRRICPRTPTAVIHNGVDAEYFSPQDGPADPKNLVFEGNLAFGPNADAILYFCREILPLIWQSAPDVTLTIVGKNPPPAVQALSGTNVTVTGYVDDVRPYIDRAALFVCPLRKGAGIKNKILQAWAMEKAVVATSQSTGGLLVREGENICVRETPEDFSAAVLKLLDDEAARQAMGEAARKTILEHYTWAAKADELESVMHSLENRHCRGPQETVVRD